MSSSAQKPAKVMTRRAAKRHSDTKVSSLLPVRAAWTYACHVLIGIIIIEGLRRAKSGLTLSSQGDIIESRTEPPEVTPIDLLKLWSVQLWLRKRQCFARRNKNDQLGMNGIKKIVSASITRIRLVI